MNGKMMRIRVLVGVVAFLVAISWSSLVLAQTTPAFVYISPRPEARFVPPETTITLRNGKLLDENSLSASFFTVVGEQSGIHPGTLLLAEDGKTLIFRPDQPFAAGERVTSHVAPGLRTTGGEVLDGVSFQFTISPKIQGEQLNLSPESTDTVWDSPWASVPPADVKANSILSRYVTLPEDFPTINVTVATSQAAEGYIFLSSYHHLWSLGAQPYLLVLDNAGEPVFYRRMPPLNNLDFKTQPNGLLTYFSRATNLLYVMDNSYTIVDTYEAGNGYLMDHHDFQLLPNGHALLMIWDPQPVDMSQIVEDGDPAATVIGLVIQELDSAKNVVFQWSSWDHFAITDTQVNLTAAQIAYVHGNAVELDFDGNLLISNRAMDEITKIDRETGDVIWRLGGRQNEFTFFDEDGPFYGQHDIRRLPNGNVTIYDNREGHFPYFSRAVEYQLDEEAKTATIAWQYRNTPDIYGAWLGNAQRLPNGNTLIGWGSTVPTMTEVTPQGEVAFELTFSWPIVSYRAFRFPWRGAPTWPPLLVMKAAETTTTLHYSWNGATDVAAYRVMAGSTADSMEQIGTQRKTGFEESTDISQWMGDYCFFRVIPLDKVRNELQASNVVLAPGCSYQTFLPLAVRNE